MDMKDFSTIDMSEPQYKLMRIIHKWDGDLSPDAEDEIGCTGAAFDAVLGSCIVRKYLAPLAHGTYEITKLGKDVMKDYVQQYRETKAA